MASCTPSRSRSCVLVRPSVVCYANAPCMLQAALLGVGSIVGQLSCSMSRANECLCCAFLHPVLAVQACLWMYCRSATMPT